LKRLNIAYNNFTSLDDLFLHCDDTSEVLPKLTRLIASGNKLTSVPIELSKRYLTHLHLGYNEIGNISLEFINNINSSIVSLSLFGNKILDTIGHIHEQLKKCHDSRIDISHNQIYINELAKAQSNVMDNTGNNYENYYFQYNINQANNNDILISPFMIIQNDITGNNGSILSGAAHMQGERQTNEDSLVIHNNVKIDETLTNIHLQVYAVFDGHGGEVCARYSSANIDRLLAKVFQENIAEYEQAEDKMAFEKKLVEMTIERLDTDIEQMNIKDGCTAAIVVVVNYKHCICANIGDARIVLIENRSVNSTDIIAKRLSIDHKANEPSERIRMMSLGGCIYDGRINGFSLSRALGDHEQRPLISSQPHVTGFIIDPQIHQFLIIACDGVWDVVDDQTAAELVMNTFEKSCSMENKSGNAKVALCAAVLRDYAYSLRSMDNISVIVCKFMAQSNPN